MVLLFNTCPICSVISTRVDKTLVHYDNNYHCKSCYKSNDLLVGYDVLTFELCKHTVCITCVNDFINENIDNYNIIDKLKINLPENFYVTICFYSLLTSNIFKYCGRCVRWLEYDDRIILFDVNNEDYKNPIYKVDRSHSDNIPWTPRGYIANGYYYDEDEVWIMEDEIKWY